MTATAALEIVEYTDAACPWAWGSEPTFRWLRLALRASLADGRVRWRRVFGMLFDDADPPAPDREAETRHYERWLAGVSAHTGAPYPRRLHWVAATSRPAAVVARAAQAQGDEVADRVLRRLRETTFVYGRPADTPAAALAAAAEVAGVDLGRLRDDVVLTSVGRSVEADRDETRRPDPAVEAAVGEGPHPGSSKNLDPGRRYALPTLVLRGVGGTHFVPGWHPLDRYVTALAAAAPDVALDVVDEDPDVVLNEVGSVTGPELDTLCRGRLPARGRRIATRNTQLWRPI